MELRNAIAVWDFTVNNPVEETKDWMVNRLKEYCKKWCFQLESGSDNHVTHWQGRVSLKNKTKSLKTLATILPRAHWSPTSQEGKKQNFYVTKEETRLEGPYSDENEPQEIPWDIEHIYVMRPWQQYVIDDVEKNKCIREIDILLCREGNIGKTTLAKILGTKYKGHETLPPINDIKELMQIVMCICEKYGYPKSLHVDMPRALNKEKQFSFWAGIESIKGGFCYDTRYSYDRKWIPAPRIWIYTNYLPELDTLSIDRWRFWMVDKTTQEIFRVYPKGNSEETLESLYNLYKPRNGVGRCAVTVATPEENNLKEKLKSSEPLAPTKVLKVIRRNGTQKKIEDLQEEKTN